MVSLYLLCLFTRGRWVVKNGQNIVYVVCEWPLYVTIFSKKKSRLTFPCGPTIRGCPMPCWLFGTGFIPGVWDRIFCCIIGEPWFWSPETKEYINKRSEKLLSFKKVRYGLFCHLPFKCFVFFLWKQMHFCKTIKIKWEIVFCSVFFYDTSVGNSFDLWFEFFPSYRSRQKGTEGKFFEAEAAFLRPRP